MKYLAAFLFTVICKPGYLYKINEECEIIGDRGVYYYYNLDLTSDVYLYVSYGRDSVWFYVEQDYIDYLNNGLKNTEFQINPQ